MRESAKHGLDEQAVLYSSNGNFCCAILANLPNDSSDRGCPPLSALYKLCTWKTTTDPGPHPQTRSQRQSRQTKSGETPDSQPQSRRCSSHSHTGRRGTESRHSRRWSSPCRNPPPPSPRRTTS